MNTSLHLILSTVNIAFAFFYIVGFVVYFARNRNTFWRDGKLSTLGIFNILNYFFLVYFLGALDEEMKHTTAILAAIISILFSLQTSYFYHKGINKKGIRWFYRIYFAYSIFVFPTLMLDIDDVGRLCLALVLSYLFCSTLNRVFCGKFAEDDPLGSRTVWLKCDNNSFLSDVLRFRSEFSVNTPGGHRQVIESFYPYFFSTCGVILLAIHVLNINQVKFDYALAIIDNSLAGQIVSFSKPSSAPYEASMDMASKSPETQTSPAVKVTIPPIQENLLIRELENRPQRSLVVKYDRNPAEGGISKSADLITLRNFIFLLLLIVTAWFLNSRGIKNSYVDKWKVLNSELNGLYGEDNNPTQMTQKKIIFACNLIVMEMWGHRSYNIVFWKILDDLKGTIPDHDKIISSQLEANTLLKSLQELLVMPSNP